MPKIVAHDERRRELARAALRVIGRDGLEGATTRNVATESGWSTGVLKHYFASKDELLALALRELESEAKARFEVAAGAPDGLSAVHAAVAGILASDHEHTRIWIAFMDRAGSDPQTATAWKQAARTWVRRWSDLVRRGQLDGSIRSELDARQAGEELHAVVNGLRINAHFGLDATMPAQVLAGLRLEQ